MLILNRFVKHYVQVYKYLLGNVYHNNSFLIAWLFAKSDHQPAIFEASRTSRSNGPIAILVSSPDPLLAFVTRCKEWLLPPLRYSVESFGQRFGTLFRTRWGGAGRRKLNARAWKRNELCEARSRLYRRRCSRPSIRWKALDEICQMYLSNRIFFKHISPQNVAFQYLLKCKKFAFSNYAAMFTEM